QIDENQLGNIRLLKDDAGRLLDALPAASLARVYILYPDPWPKRRQRKRRFISDAMLQRLARVMQPGAQLRFATDIDDYAGWVLQRVLRSPDFVWPVTNARDWLVPWPNWPGTRYEQKALAAGRHPVYLTFTRDQAAKA
ncbi:MAG: tRNA (guanosine(46)-N7)-methyltransferase TrmB, partial [Hyphomicrobiales bacterium]|nr:tRNA (guanosine(46)-N7)-methyltransferase TrmB [Hyphomicrobiales bacterium]